MCEAERELREMSLYFKKKCPKEYIEFEQMRVEKLRKEAFGEQ